MRPHLRVEARSADKVDVHWKPKGRPLQIERETNEARVRADVGEVIEQLEAVKSAGAKRVCDGLVCFYHCDWASPAERRANVYSTRG